MPSWLFPAVLSGGLSLFTGALAVIWAEIKASEARTEKRLDELKADLKADLKASEVRQQEALKATEDRQQEALKAMEDRQREEMREMRADLKALGGKVDRLLESLVAAKAS